MHCRQAVFCGILLIASSWLGVTPCDASEPKTLHFSTVLEADQLVRPGKKVLTVAYKKLNIQFDAIPLPPARSLVQANSGEYDGELGRSQSVESELPNLLRVPTPIGLVDYIPYAIKNVGAASSWTALKESKLRVGVRVGDILTEKRLGDAISSKVPTYKSLFQMLALNRIDVVIAPQGELRRLLPLLSPDVQLKLREVTSLPLLSSVPIYHFLHVRNKDLIEPLDRELQLLTKDGTIKKIWSEIQ